MQEGGQGTTEALLGERAVGVEDAVEEAFPYFEEVEGGESPGWGGEVGLEGGEGGVAGGAVGGDEGFEEGGEVGSGSAGHGGSLV